MFAPMLRDSLVQALVLICMPVVLCQWQLLFLTLVENTGNMTMPEMFASSYVWSHVVLTATLMLKGQIYHACTIA